MVDGLGVDGSGGLAEAVERSSGCSLIALRRVDGRNVCGNGRLDVFAHAHKLPKGLNDRGIEHPAGLLRDRGHDLLARVSRPVETFVVVRTIGMIEVPRRRTRLVSSPIAWTSTCRESGICSRADGEPCSTLSREAHGVFAAYG
jgi:hypothetical protein